MNEYILKRGIKFLASTNVINSAVDLIDVLVSLTETFLYFYVGTGTDFVFSTKFGTSLQQCPSYDLQGRGYSRYFIYFASNGDCFGSSGPAS